MAVATGAGGEGEFGEEGEAFVIPVAAVSDGALSVVGVLLEEIDGLVVLGGFIPGGNDRDVFTGIIAGEGVSLGDFVEGVSLGVAGVDGSFADGPIEVGGSEGGFVGVKDQVGEGTHFLGLDVGDGFKVLDAVEFDGFVSIRLVVDAELFS